MREGRGDASLFFRVKRELVIIQTGTDDFMCLSGERIDTETDAGVYPFGHAVTLRLSPDSAARVGQDTITISESEILQDCEIPKATDTEADTESQRMVTLFEVMDSAGKVVATGEIDNDIYRVYEVGIFESVEAVLAACGGIGFQPEMFQTPASEQQLRLF